MPLFHLSMIRDRWRDKTHTGVRLVFKCQECMLIISNVVSLEVVQLIRVDTATDF